MSQGDRFKAKRRIHLLRLILGYGDCMISAVKCSTNMTSEPMEEFVYQLNTRHKPRLLFAMMDALADNNSKISLEGYLSKTELARIEAVSHEETEVLKRGTLQPRLDFLVLALTPQMVPAIKKAIHSKIAFGRNGIIHVQIEKAGKLSFAAYGDFHPECTVAYSAVSPQFLQDLIETRVLRRYERVPLAVKVQRGP